VSKPVAIITGEGKGIGRATAIELAARGYDLVVTARTQRDLDETIKQAGTGVAIPADVSRLEDVERVVAETSKRFGRIDALVNNAGYAPVRSIAQMTTDEWRQVIDTNLSATF
jgi:3-oxoacyl-[acyl-carrier protein] reductase